MAVAETATAQSKGSRNESSRASPASGTSDCESGKAAFSLTLGASLVLLTGLLAAPLNAQVIADRNAPGNQQPTVLQTASGVTQVNIMPPSAAGVSRNTFSQLDVVDKGVILNNGRTDSTTQIGGYVQANPWLATGGARIILNEVNSSNPSQIKGYVEVAGQRAEVIIANPAGIAVSGGGFLNASAVTLTTGTAVMNAGSLDSFKVRGGTVTIDGTGLNTRNADYTSILARAAQVNAGIWAKDLKVVTGPNDISVSSAASPRVTATATGTDATPAFALDVAALGGMYAGKIFLIGTEAGLGVRNSGVIGATAGDVVLTNDGWLRNSGGIYATGNTSVTAQGDITNSGSVAALGNTSLSAQGVNAKGTASQISSSAGSVIAAGLDTKGNIAANVGTNTLDSAGSASINGQIASGADTHISARAIDLRNATLNAANTSLVASVADINASGASLGVQGTLFATTSQTLRTDGAKVSANQLNLTAHDLSNVAGQVIQIGTADTRIALAGNLDNTHGQIGANSQRLSLSVTTLTNSAGKIEHAGAGALSVTADTLRGSGGTILSNGALNLNANTIGLQNATTTAASVSIVGGSLTNAAGIIQSTGGNLNVQTGSLSNAAGWLYASGDLGMRVDSLTNSGSVYAAGNTDVQATLGITNTGTIAALGHTTLAAQSVSSSSGSLLAAGMQADRTLAKSGPKNVQVRTSAFTRANGQNLASGDIEITASSVDLTQSQTGAANINLQAMEGDISTRSASMVTPGTLRIAAHANDAQTWNNSAVAGATSAGLVQAGQLQVTVANLNNQGGVIAQSGTGDTAIALTSATGTMNNAQGRIATNSQNLGLTTAILNNVAGTIEQAGSGALSITAGHLNGSGGTVVSHGQLRLQGGTLDLNGGTTHAQRISISAASLNNAGGQIVQLATTGTAGAIAVTGSIDNTAGMIASNSGLSLDAGSLANHAGKIVQSADTGVANVRVSGTLDNSQGTVASNAGLLVQAGNLNNAAGKISQSAASGTTAASIVVTSALDNSVGGNIASKVGLSVSAANLNNHTGQIIQSGASGQAIVAIDTTLDNTSGTIASNADLNIQAASLDNRGGKLAAIGDLTVAGNLDNTGGLVRTLGTLQITGDQVINYATLAVDANGQPTNQGLEGHDIVIRSKALDNRIGAIRADHDLSLYTAQNLDNSAGLINAGNALIIQDAASAVTSTAERLLMIDNALGVLNAGSSNSVAALGISGDGRILSQGSLSLDLSNDFNNTGDVIANGNLHVATTGNIANSAKLQAGQTVTLSAANISNFALGQIAGNNTSVTASNTLTNRGLIDGANTQVNAATLSNIGTGKIYGDYISIAAGTLNNDFETVAGVTTAATIAARQNLDIGVGTLNNSNGASIFSVGDTRIGGALGVNRQAVGHATTITNRASSIEALGSVNINTETLQNLNTGFSYQVVSGTPSAEKTEYILSNGQTVQDSQVAVDNGKLSGYTVAQGPTSPHGKVLLNSDPLATSSNIFVYKAGAVYTPNTLACWGRGCASTPVTFSVPSDTSIWTMMGMAVPSAPPPTGNRPASHYAAPTPWDVAAAPYIELQRKIDAMRSQMNANMLTVQAYNVYTATSEQAQVRGGTPGTIRGGGNITINASNSALNDNSHIIAGGALSVNVLGGQLSNTSTDVIVNTDKVGYGFGWGCVNIRDSRVCGVGYYNQGHIASRPDLRQNPFTQSIPTTVQVSNSQALQYTAVSIGQKGSSSATTAGTVSDVSGPGQLISQSGTTITSQASVSQSEQRSTTVAAVTLGDTAAQSGQSAKGGANSMVPASASVSTGSSATASRLQGFTSVNTPTKVPTSSLYSINSDPDSSALVQTDPRFTNQRAWLSSDYMTAQIALDPSVTQKRLGDGFYEQRLIREQVAELTGKRFLGDYTSDQQEYHALMDSGLTFATAQNLRPGIALTAAQIATLTTDIVWLQQENVTLPDGTVTQALVPHIYAAVREGDLAPSGALLGGDTVAASTRGDLTNSGSIMGRKVVQLHADSINNLGGQMSAQAVALIAQKDINNVGGTVAALDSLAAVAGGDIHVTSTTQSSSGSAGSYSFSQSGIDRVAAMYVRGAGTLQLGAGKDIHLTAAQLSSGGKVQMVAGNNLTLSTVTTSRSDNFNATNADNRFLSSSSKDVGTGITSAGKTELWAGNTLSATAANVNATGDLSINAHNVALLAGQSKASSDSVMTSSSGDWLSSTTTVTQERHASANAVASNLGARRVSISAANDITVKGSNVVADQDVSLAAKHNVNITADANTSRSSRFTQKSESGFLSGGGLGITYGNRDQSLDQKETTTTAAASTIGSIGGNVKISAGNTFTQTGSDVLTPGGDIAIAAASVNIKEARQTGSSQAETKFNQSGISVGFSGGVIDTGQATAQGIQSIASNNSNRNKALNALIAYGKDSDLVEQGKAIGNAYNQNGVMGSEGNPGAAAASGIKVNVGIGSSSSQSNSKTTTNTSAASTVKAEGNVVIRATGQNHGEGNLTVQGSNVQAAGNATLSATQNVNIVASADTVSNRSTNSSRANNVGVSFGVGKGGAGLSLDVSASRGQGRANSDSTTYNNSQISAGSKVSISSGADTNIAGGNITAHQVTADVGGNFNIASLQDSAKSNASQSTTGLSVSIPIGPGAGSFSASQSNQNSRSDYKSVNQQSGINAGDGGFQINVAGNTDLKGAVITSTDKAIKDGNNTLTTKTLTTSDLQNSKSANASSSGTSIGTDMLQGKYALAKGAAGNLMNNGSANDNDASTATTAISAAKVTVGGRTTDTSEAQLTDSNGNAVSVDTTNTNRILAKVDVADLQNQALQKQADNMLLLKAATAFSDEAYRTLYQAGAKMYRVPPGCSDQSCAIPLTQQEAMNLKNSQDGNVHLSNNGIFNNLDDAVKYAQNHGGTMNADGSKDYTIKPENQYIILTPQSNNIISETIIAAVQKSGLTPHVGLTSAEEQTANVLRQVTQQGQSIVVDSHSRGTLTTTNAEQYLVNQGGIKNENGNPIQPSIQMNNYGGAQNVQTGNQTLQQLTANENATVNSVVHPNDLIGTVIGGNAPTPTHTSTTADGAKTEVNAASDGRSAVGNALNVLTGTATPHNCYGTASKDCGSEWKNLPVSSSPKITNPDYKPPVVIPQFQQVNGVSPKVERNSAAQMNQPVLPVAPLPTITVLPAASNSGLETLQKLKQEQ